MNSLARLMYLLEMTINQGKLPSDSLLENQAVEVQNEWQGYAEAVNRFLGG